MRYAIFSDVHSNLQALRCVLARADDLGVDRRLCLGDLVGYGGNPNECIEAIRLAGAECLAGNHDHAALGLTPVAHFNSPARAAALWTGEVLDEDNRRFLSSLPLVLRTNGVFCVHASPREPDQWHYVLTPHQAEQAFECFEGGVCVIGHSHRPLTVIKREGTPCDLTVREEIWLDSKFRYVINGGSVGQPRDGNPSASFIHLDTDRGWARIERVPYDVKGAQRAILDAGLPDLLAERLENGR